jgi:hypothetical protein
MNMSDLDEYVAETFPDEGQRADRRKLLHERLDTFLEDYLENDGSWVVLPDYTLHHQFHDLFREIVDLKVARDCDGDSQFEISLNDRKRGRLTEIRIPSMDYTDITEDVDHDYVRDLTNAVSAAGSAANSISLELESYFRQMRSLRDQRLEGERKFVEIEAILREGDYETASKAILDFMKGNGHQYNDHPKVADLHAIMNERFTAERDALIEQAIVKITPFETDNDHDWPMVRSFIADCQRLFSTKFGHDVPAFYDKRKDLYDKGYAARLAKRKAGIR